MCHDVVYIVSHSFMSPSLILCNDIMTDYLPSSQRSSSQLALWSNAVILRGHQIYIFADMHFLRGLQDSEMEYIFLFVPACPSDLCAFFAPHDNWLLPF